MQSFDKRKEIYLPLFQGVLSFKGVRNSEVSVIRRCPLFRSVRQFEMSVIHSNVTIVVFIIHCSSSF